MTADWLILGGGVGGLTLAAKLAEHGKSFLVLEKDEVADDAGAGLLLAPNAGRILQSLGLLSRVLELGHATDRWFILNQSGAPLRELRIGTKDLPAVSVHRADLLRLLRSKISTGTLQTSVQVLAIRTKDGNVSVSCVGGPDVSGRALIGADGIKSLVRRHLFGDRPLRYRGYVGWRGIAPFVPAGYAQGLLSESWGPGGRFGIAPVDATRTYWYASANQAESWVDQVPERRSALLKRFADWHKPVTDLIAATPTEKIVVSRIYDGPKLTSWSRENITLLGDAAHAITPNLGQGACLAMEDAWMLGSIISCHSEPAIAFQKYQQSRMRRALSIQRQSRVMGWIVQTESPLTLAIRDWMTPRLPGSLINRGMQTLFAGTL